jgi:hypothetical protein
MDTNTPLPIRSERPAERFERSVASIRRADSLRAQGDKDDAQMRLARINDLQATCQEVCRHAINSLAEHVGERIGGSEHRKAIDSLRDLLSDLTFDARNALAGEIDAADDEIRKADAP